MIIWLQVCSHIIILSIQTLKPFLINIPHIPSILHKSVKILKIELTQRTLYINVENNFSCPLFFIISKKSKTFSLQQTKSRRVGHYSILTQNMTIHSATPAASK